MKKTPPVSNPLKVVSSRTTATRVNITPAGMIAHQLARFEK
jgi:hypothetical protein